MSQQLRSVPSSGPSWRSSIAQAWQAAVEALVAHKLRAGLTLLTIVVGIAAVLTLSVLSRLTEQAVARNFGPLGATLISISPQAPKMPDGPITINSDKAPPPDVELSDKDLQALRSLPHVQSAALHTAMPPVRAIGNGQNGEARLFAATPEIQNILGYGLASGSFFTTQDEDARANVVVLGASVAHNLFPDKDPVDQAIQLNNVPFTVKGVLSPQGSNGDQDLDDVVFVPYSVIDRLRGNGRVFAIGNTNPLLSNGVLLQVDDAHNISRVEASATQLLNQLYPPKAGQQPFAANDFTQAVQSANESTSQVRLALTGIAAVLLVLGAFGLFNMMTVTVIERTREIGMRMAIGARTRDVLAQFLIEAGLLGLVGGLVGAVVGAGLAVFVTTSGPLASMYAPVLGMGGSRPITGPPAGARVMVPDGAQIPTGPSVQLPPGGPAGSPDVPATLPSVEAVIAVVLGAVILGIIFGVVPARRAANLDPATALRR